MSGILSLAESLATPVALSDQTVALNPSRAAIDWIDLARQLLGVAKLLAWAALGLYLLWRSGIGPRAAGLTPKPRFGRDIAPGFGLAAVIGLPGLLFYLVAQALSINLTVQASALDDHWWRVPILVLSAIANSGAEEVLVVAYLITRLRTLGWSENKSLLASSLLRGSYHLYQGFGGGVGNVIMGLVVRPVLAAHRETLAAGHRPRSHRHGGVHRLRPPARSRLLAAVTGTVNW